MINNQSLYTRDFILLTISAFLYFFNFHGYILLPVRISDLGGTESDIGFIMGAASLSTILSTPLAGYLVDRYLLKRVMFAGSVLLVISGLILIFIEELNFYYSVIRFFQGASFSFYFVSAGTLVSVISPEGKRTQSLGVFGVFTIINYALAPYIGRMIMGNYGFNDFLILLSLTGMLSIIFMIPIKADRSGYQEEKSFSDSIINGLKKLQVVVPLLTLFFLGSGFIATLTFLPVFSLELGVEEYEIYFICYTISVLFIRIFAGWLPDRFGKLKVVYPSLIIFCAGIIALGFSDNKSDLILSSVLFGVGHGFLYPTLYALVIESGHSSIRGKLFSLCSVSFTFGGMAGSFIYGLVAENYGYFIMYKIMGVVCLSGFVLFSYYRLKNRGYLID